MFVGEGPGADEDALGELRPGFSGHFQEVPGLLRGGYDRPRASIEIDTVERGDDLVTLAVSVFVNNRVNRAMSATDE